MSRAISRPALVLRPAPGDAATAARLAAAGLVAIRLPLFEIVPLAWELPAGEFDALLLTSANAVRHAGAALRAVRSLPVIAVGQATAAAARAADLDVAAVGGDDGASAVVLAQARRWHRILRLAGRERTELAGVTDVAVYASALRIVAPGGLGVARNAVALLHSSRAAHAFAQLIDRDQVSRADVRLAAISAPVAATAGLGWGALRVAATPDDEALVALAETLAIDR